MCPFCHPFLLQHLQFHRLKSFKSEPREEDKKSLLGREINDTYFTVNGNASERQTNYFSQQISKEERAPLPVVTRQIASFATTSASPVDEQNADFPVTDFPLPQQQGTREAISSQTEKDRVKFLINQAINDISNSFSLKCPLCKKDTNFKKAGFFTRNVHKKTRLPAKCHRANNHQRKFRKNKPQTARRTEEKSFT